MYSVLSYGEMAGDRVRMDAYARAIERVVKPGDVVLDIGAGTGIMSLLALKAGAKRVHAIEPNPAIELVPAVAHENGLGDRVVIHAESSLDVELPERADVVVSDLRGSFPLNPYHAELLRDARRRLLKPGGALLPTRDRFLVAAIDSAEVTHYLDQGADGYERLGFRASALRSSIANTVHMDSRCRVKASDLVTRPEVWGSIEYGQEGVPFFEGRATLTATRRGTPVALALWFEATIHEELGYTNAPGHALVYSRLILPLEKAFDLKAGDQIALTIRVDERGSRWAWDTSFSGSSARQSSFFGLPTSAKSLLRASSSFTPSRSARGDRMLAILEAMNGDRNAAQLVAAAERTTADEVGEAIERYGR